MPTAVLTPYQRMQDELAWLKDHPEFQERPATLLEFLGPDYLNCDEMTRDAIKECLANIMGHEVSALKPTVYELAMITGGIGIGKTTIASIVLPYLVHWCLCLKDPQRFFGLMAGSRIAFMQMSTSEQQAKEVVFGDIKARINHSPWFKKYPPDPAFKNQFRFERDIWIIPGDSTETTFEGYNILGGILDEADSHKVTKVKDYADQGFDTIYNRMSSRFDDRGFLLVIGQMKSSTGFAARKYAELRNNPKAYATRMTIWESRGDKHFICKEVGPHPQDVDNPVGKSCGQVHKFAFDSFRKQIIPPEVVPTITNDAMMMIPEVYRSQFEHNPEKALKDLAGIPPAVGDPFIALSFKIHEAFSAWTAGNGPVVPVDPRGVIIPTFHAKEKLPRAVHVDIAYAAGGDALAIAMGHVREMKIIDGERKPHIVIDFLMRMTAPAGGEIYLGNMRQVIYSLKDTFGFKISMITLDGFQSQDTIQQFNKRRFNADYLSMDRQLLPYHDLREAIYENRIEIPPYMVRYRNDDTEMTNIGLKELSELVDMGNKVDHPVGGSKDVADALAGVVYTLMGDRRYHRSIPGLGTMLTQSSGGYQETGLFHPAFMGDRGMRAPVPPGGTF